MDDETTFEDLAAEPPAVSVLGPAVLLLPPGPGSLAMTSTAARLLADQLIAAAAQAEEAL
jgi:hypothetical protein